MAIWSHLPNPTHVTYGAQKIIFKFSINISAEIVKSILDYKISFNALRAEDTHYEALGMNYSTAGFELVLSRKMSFYVNIASNNLISKRSSPKLSRDFKSFRVLWDSRITEPPYYYQYIVLCKPRSSLTTSHPASLLESPGSGRLHLICEI